MAQGTINNTALFNHYNNADFISHSMKIKNMLICIYYSYEIVYTIHTVIYICYIYIYIYVL